MAEVDRMNLVGDPDIGSFQYGSSYRPPASGRALPSSGTHRQ